MLRIHFVCPDNLCRSVMGEYLLQKKLRKIDVADILTDSSGTMAIDGNRVASSCAVPLQEMGIKMDAHRTRRITQEVIAESDYILVMETHHYQSVVAIAPEHENKVMMLGDYIDSGHHAEIADPYGVEPAEIYRAFKLIDEACDSVVRKIGKGQPLII